MNNYVIGGATCIVEDSDRGFKTRIQLPETQTNHYVSFVHIYTLYLVIVFITLFIDIYIYRILLTTKISGRYMCHIRYTHTAVV